MHREAIYLSMNTTVILVFGLISATWPVYGHFSCLIESDQIRLLIACTGGERQPTIVFE